MTLRSLNYTLIDEELFKKCSGGILLKCVSLQEARMFMAEVHEGIYEAHQAGQRMRWLIIRSRYFWSRMGESCVQYAKSCLTCQKRGPIQRALAREMTPIIKHWPFKGRAIDLIGKIYPPSSKQHTFIIVATDFFTKWVR